MHVKWVSHDIFHVEVEALKGQYTAVRDKELKVLNHRNRTQRLYGNSLNTDISTSL